METDHTPNTYKKRAARSPQPAIDTAAVEAAVEALRELKDPDRLWSIAANAPENMSQDAVDLLVTLARSVYDDPTMVYRFACRLYSATGKLAAGSGVCLSIYEAR